MRSRNHQARTMSALDLFAASGSILDAARVISDIQSIEIDQTQNFIKAYARAISENNNSHALKIFKEAAIDRIARSDLNHKRIDALLSNICLTMHTAAKKYSQESALSIGKLLKESNANRSPIGVKKTIQEHQYID